MFDKFAHMLLTFLLSLFLNYAGNTSLLDRIDSIIESDPDSAYVLLTDLDRSDLSRKEMARFSVLYSMALDKNYIDVASDSIICYAVNYYRHHGDADYKMRAYYYLGLVKQNAGDIDGAMESYVKAERYGRRSDNQRMRGRVYMGLKTLHRNLFDIQKASVSARNAAECFLAAGDTSRYINAGLDECSCLLSLQDYDRADSLLGRLSVVQNRMGMKQYSTFLITDLLVKEENGTGSLQSMRESLGKMTYIPTVLWIDIAYLYYKYNDIESARESIAKYEEDASADLSSPVYYLVKSKLYASESSYQDAFYSLSKYIDAKDSLDLQVMRSSAPFEEERYEHQMDELKQRNQKMVVLLLFMAAAFAAYIIRDKLARERHRTSALQTEKTLLEMEVKNQSEQIVQADQEIMQLKRILSENTLTSEIRQQVDVRLAILNKYVAHQISQTSNQGGTDALKELLNDRKEFLKSMVASFTIAHPKFVRYLDDIGMTEREAGCCCLYCIGLRGSEIASYLELSEQSYYNFSSKIRKKLGQSSYTSNIDTVLKKKLSEYDDGL